MTSYEKLYLRQNIQVEPLIDHWYAWSHLIPSRYHGPKHHRTAPQNHGLLHQHPQVHANAVKNPKMVGGPFIDYGGKRVDEIRELRDRIKTDAQPS